MLTSRFIIIIVAIIYNTVCWATPTSSPKTLTVLLDQSININHAPLVIAQTQSYFKKNNLKVILLTPKKHDHAIKSLKEQSSDLALTHQPSFIRATHQDHSIVHIGSLIDKPLIFLVALKKGNIQSLKDLKGKRIALEHKATSLTMLHSMLAYAHLSIADVKISTHYHDLTHALLSHQVDAVLGSTTKINIPLIESKHHQINTFYPEEYGMPTYHELIFISRSHMNHDTRLKPFFQALEQAVRYIDQHPEQAYQQFNEYTHKTKNPIDHKKWFDTIAYFSETPAEYNSNQWKALAYYFNKDKIMANNAIDQSKLKKQKALIHELDLIENNKKEKREHTHNM